MRAETPISAAALPDSSLLVPPCRSYFYSEASCSVQGCSVVFAAALANEMAEAFLEPAAPAAAAVIPSGVLGALMKKAGML